MSVNATIPMRPRRLRRLLWLIALGAIVAAASLTLVMPKANATPLSYLQSLNQHGLTVTDTAAALTTGYAICQMLNAGNGNDVSQYVYLHTDITTLSQAQVMVVSAVEELCPWQDHRGQAVPTSGGSIGGAYVA